VPTATSYSWTVPAGASIVSTAPNGLSIVVRFTPAFTTNLAYICVAANSACGPGPARCFAITSRAASPVITGATSVCKSNTAIAYSLAPVPSATSYSWSITGGASIAPSGTNATINYSSSLSNSAVIRANANNACGASQPGQLTVAVNLFCRTSDEDLTDVATVLGAYPNPTSGKATVSFNATSESRYLVKVTNMLGEAVAIEIVNAIIGNNTREIDLTGLARGVYVLSVSSKDDATESIRLIVK
jgi:hypothetical protein